MSNNQALAPAAAFASKVFLSKFKDVTPDKLAALALAPAALPDDAPIKARDIRLSKDDGRALAGSSFTAGTFTKAIAHRLALFAGGQALDDLVRGMPEMAHRIAVQIDWEPEGFLERAGALVGAGAHAVKKDLKNFKEFIEGRGSETGAWRGDVKA